MPDPDRIQHAAHTVVTRCLALPTESEVAIIADETTLAIAQALASAAESNDHRSHLIFFHSTVQAGLAQKPLGETIKSVLRDVAGTILCTNGSALCLSFRDNIRRAAWGRGRKVAHMPGANWRTLLAADADYDYLAHWCELLALSLVKGREIRITSFDREGRAHSLKAALSPWLRMPIISDGIIHDGAWGNVPSGETFVAPMENSAEGEIVINGSIPGMVLTPHLELVLRFEAGRVVSITPDENPAAQHLRQSILKHAHEQGDPNWDNLAEIGLGVNQSVRRLTGVPLLDEKKYGSAHIALGDSTDMGGEVPSLVHCDMVCLRPEVTVDGKPILAGGKIVLNEADWREDYRTLQLPDGWNPRRTVTATAIEAKVNGRGQLHRQWDTSSGRLCAVPVGNEATAIKAAGLWRALKDAARPIDLHELYPTWRDVDDNSVERLVHLLELYGLAQTE
jgi:leucyl aminopeptidase (aminopeptidase T)